MQVATGANEWKKKSKREMARNAVANGRRIPGVVFLIEYSDEGGWVSCRILVVEVLF